MENIIRKKNVFLYIILLAANGMLSFTIYKSHQNLLKSQDLVEHTDKVIYLAGNILSHFKDLEIAPYRFSLTNDSTSVEMLNSATRLSFIDIKKLRELVNDNLPQQKRVDTLSAILNERLAFSRHVITVRRTEGLAAVISLMATSGTVYTRQARFLTATIQNNEGILLHHRINAYIERTVRFKFFLIFLFLLMTMFSILLLRTSNGHQRKTEDIKMHLGQLKTVNNQLAFQIEEKDKRAAELATATKELAFQNKEKGKRAYELIIANDELAIQNEEKGKRAEELEIANHELAFQNEEKRKRADELVIANEELAFQNEERGKRADELVVANEELAFQNEEKGKRADELVIANEELAFQNEEKGKRADELVIANEELAFQNEEKGKRADELVIANEELAFQNEEKGKRADELVIANEELAFQNEEKGKRADELVIANKELAFQNEEKGKRADELVIANKELAFQNEEKGKRADELVIANKELAFQNEEKGKRADELVIANYELAFQNEEKGKRADELVIVNKELAFQNEELVSAYCELKKADDNLENYLTGLKDMMFMTSHRVRQPIANILGITDQLVLLIPSPPTTKLLVDYLKQSAQKLDDFTKDLTTYMVNLESKLQTIERV